MNINSAINNKSFAPIPRYEKQPKWEKLKRKINSLLVGKIAGTALQFGLYRSYWHYKLSNKNTGELVDAVKDTRFLTQMPNYGAGIGHQLANWNSGLYFANFYSLRFAHSPFSTSEWENFLGFGEGEALASDLQKNKKEYKVVKLPRFNSLDGNEIELVGNIINSYRGANVLFQLEADQGYMAQSDTHHLLSDKFFSASARENDKLIYSAEKFNIAIHIRRRMKIETDEVWTERGLDNTYFANILTDVLSLLKDKGQAVVYLFSQGNIDDFPEFEKFDNINYCMHMGPVETVLHLVHADLLIGSKSSFSYKPALISKSIQICPKSFWHNYPKEPNYILADDNGQFDELSLSARLNAAIKLNNESKLETSDNS